MRTNVTISCFYFGDTRQAKTALHLSAIFITKDEISFFFIATINAAPEIINANCS